MHPEGVYTTMAFNPSEYVVAYQRDHYDTIKIRIPKGERDRWKAAADTHGQSLNSFVIETVEARIESESKTE